MGEMMWRDNGFELPARRSRSLLLAGSSSDTVDHKLRLVRTDGNAGLLEVLKLGGGDVALEFGFVVFGNRGCAGVTPFRCVLELLLSELQFEAGDLNRITVQFGASHIAIQLGLVVLRLAYGADFMPLPGSLELFLRKIQLEPLDFAVL